MSYSTSIYPRGYLVKRANRKKAVHIFLNAKSIL
jgi:hypothetical protein